MTQHYAGYAQQLLLALAYAIVAEDCVQTAWQPLDEFPAMRSLGRLYNLVVSGIGLAKAYVLPHRVTFEPGVLEDHSVVAPERVSSDVLDGGSVYGDCAAIDVVEPHEQVDDRRLPAACWAYDGDLHARFCMDVEIFYERMILFVAERNVLYVDGPSNRAKFQGCFRCFLFFL